MKKIAFVLATAGLMTLAACTKTPEAATDNNTTDMMVENMANEMDAMAADTGNAMDNAADAMEATANTVATNM